MNPFYLLTGSYSAVSFNCASGLMIEWITYGAYGDVVQDV